MTGVRLVFEFLLAPFFSFALRSTLYAPSVGSEEYCVCRIIIACVQLQEVHLRRVCLRLMIVLCCEMMLHALLFRPQFTCEILVIGAYKPQVISQSTLERQGSRAPATYTYVSQIMRFETSSTKYMHQNKKRRFPFPSMKPTLPSGASIHDTPILPYLLQMLHPYALV